MPTAIRRVLGVLCALVFATTMLAFPASATPNDITITFVRHGESEANAGGIVDTSIPGTPLTPKGRQQAQAIADQLSTGGHDGVFASPMLRARQTAQYLADALQEPVEVLDGLREIEAGQYEGQPGAQAGPIMFDVISQWLSGDLHARIPGSAENGNDVLEQFSGAVRTIYDSGDTSPVAFSHGGSIAVWTLMSVSNPQFELFESQPLPNAGYVVIKGSPTNGWRLVDWNGTKVA